MQIPLNVKTYEHPLCTIWFEDGILCMNSHPGPRSKEMIDDIIRFVSELSGGKKVPAIADITVATAMDEETKNYSSNRTSAIYLALALVSRQHTGSQIGRAYVNLHPPYPLRMFDNKKEAKKWLQQALTEKV